MQNKSKKIFKTLLSLAILTVIFSPVMVLAADPPTIGGITTLPDSRFADTGALVLGIINWLLGLTGAVAIVAVVYSGIMYMTAGGDVTKAEAARKNLIWAITGIVIIVLSFVIVNLVITGAGGR